MLRSEQFAGLKVDGMRPWVVGFLLPPEFVLVSYASAIEPLRAANTLAQRELYAWRRISIGDKPPRDLTGCEIKAEYRVGESVNLDMVVVCSPGDPLALHDETAFAWLRKLARLRVPMAGIAGGVHIMARAGLLDEYRCAVHWAQASAFIDEFPNLRIERSLYVIDGRRITCSGGIAPMDLMLALIEAQHGRALAASISEWFVHGQVRPQTDSQRLSLSYRLGVSNSNLLRVIAAMERHLEEALTREDLAAVGGVSVRQLERLFKNHLHTTIVNYYNSLRLSRSRQLLQQTSRTITEIASASGFSSLSSFSRAYKQRFGHSPSGERDRV